MLKNEIVASLAIFFSNLVINVEYSLISDNTEHGIQADSDLDMNHSIIVDNGNYGIDINMNLFFRPVEKTERSKKHLPSGRLRADFLILEIK